MTLRISFPCGEGMPGFPRLMRIPCASAYASLTVGFLEQLCRDGKLSYILEGGERKIDRLELDRWIDEQPRQTGKLREPRAATKASPAVRT